MDAELLTHPERKMGATETRTTALQKAFIAASTYACPMVADIHRHQRDSRHDYL